MNEPSHPIETEDTREVAGLLTEMGAEHTLVGMEALLARQTLARHLLAESREDPPRYAWLYVRRLTDGGYEYAYDSAFSGTRFVSREEAVRLMAANAPSGAPTFPCLYCTAPLRFQSGMGHECWRHPGGGFYIVRCKDCGLLHDAPIVGRCERCGSDRMADHHVGTADRSGGAMEGTDEACVLCEGTGAGHVQPNGITDDCERCWGTGRGAG